MRGAITRYIPINSSGGPDVNAVAAAEQEVRRGARTILLAIHGWQVSASDFMVDVDRMSTGMAPYLDIGPLQLPGDLLVLPIHWRSCLNDDSESPARIFETLAFCAMRDRADRVGANTVARIVGALSSAAASILAGPLHFILVGHSFGCRVACACLNRLAQAGPFDAHFRTILLQGAFNSDELEAGKLYGEVHKLAASQVLVTRSAGDKALNQAYYWAEGFHRAIGDVGPTAATSTLFGPSLDVADISVLQEKHLDGNDATSGSHSNLYFDDMYRLMGEFIGRPDPPDPSTPEL